MSKWSTTFIVLFIGIGLGCGVWLGFFHDVHDLNRQLATEDRHAEVVGAKPLPVEPVKLQIDVERDFCLVIDSAEFDGDNIWIRYHMACAEDFAALYWKQVAPDGTIVENGYAWIITGGGLARGEKGEFKTDEYQFHLDPRTVIVKLKTHR
jgi:hypothetical protein